MSLDEDSLTPGLQAEIERVVHQLIWDSPVSGMDVKFFLSNLRAWLRLGHQLVEVTALMMMRDSRMREELDAMEVADESR